MGRALRSQSVSNYVIVDLLIFLYSSTTSTRNYKEKKRTFNYPNSSSAIRPVPHTEDLPVPPQQYILDSDEQHAENWEKTLQPSTSTDADCTEDLQFNEFH